MQKHLLNCWKPLRATRPQRSDETRKRDGLKMMWIGQSAAKPRIEEGSTTIAQGSRAQAIGVRSGRLHESG